jgi:acyl-coenzyme A thioesterase PaaI-like protein
MSTPASNAAGHCFVCGEHNPIGLHVHFRVEGDTCRASFTPRAEHCGYAGIVHGGILFALLDDVMANLLFLRGERAVTARAEVRYRNALPVGVGIHLEGWLTGRRGNVAMLAGRALRADDATVIAEASGRFVVDGLAPPSR